MLRKARRLDPGSPSGAVIDAEIAYTEAKALLAEGRPDRSLVLRALELDPSHAGAKELAASFETEAIGEKPEWPRRTAAGIAGAATAGLLGLVAAIALLRNRKKPGAKPATDSRAE